MSYSYIGALVVRGSKIKVFVLNSLRWYASCQFIISLVQLVLVSIIRSFSIIALRRDGMYLTNLLSKEKHMLSSSLLSIDDDEDKAFSC